MSSALVQPAERISWEQFLELPDLPNGLHAVALIDGEVVWMASPSPWHEVIGRNVLFALYAWTGPGIVRGLALTTPVVNIVGRPLGYEADVGWIPPDRVTLDGRGAPIVDGVPAIVVEVWSPSNWPGEIDQKTRDYATANVTELWGISPDLRRLTRYADLVDGRYASAVDLADDEVLTSPLLDGFSVVVGSLFVV